jgi:hypothetical protein
MSARSVDLKPLKKVALWVYKVNARAVSVRIACEAVGVDDLVKRGV